ncbi:hypothetical protein OESDEN_02551 [Oesophagostomum dentatum]|uniref:SAM domain-containing protein n=1 Tax=Oesophagostomum dentatum TaxID=61180 RepID=A0A0B1TIT4_OESDE|nr:hypothetical protein OESDEN_02551 [Oesophagostomum dentatum]
MEYQHGCLTTRELSALGIDKSIQQQIVSYLSDTDDPRPNANNFNYVSDWLCSLELTDYLGNFVTAGLKSMLVVRTAELTRKHLEVSQSAPAAWSCSITCKP